MWVTIADLPGPRSTNGARQPAILRRPARRGARLRLSRRRQHRERSSVLAASDSFVPTRRVTRPEARIVPALQGWFGEVPASRATTAGRGAYRVR
jgi:hypothetical protein